MNIHSYEAGATYEHIFYEEQRDNLSILSRSLICGARWLHDDSRWRPSKEKNGQKRVGGFARCEPLIICPDWKGLGIQCPFLRHLICRLRDGSGDVLHARVKPSASLCDK